jgi:hypothetical protein
VAVAIQFFLSYARNDDLTPTGRGDGFVTKLCTLLEYHFKKLGPPATVIWRDKGKIKPSDQFDEEIQAGISSSEVLIVVLSRNWVTRPNCLQELELFGKRYAIEGEQAIKHRIVVVAKNHLDDERRLTLLQGQEAYRYYTQQADEEQEYFRDGKLGKAFQVQTERLAKDLWHRAQGSLPPGPSIPDDRARKIYVAKPAADMRSYYEQTVEELQGRGYAVVPDPAALIPNQSGPAATAFVDEALAEAEFSIHLLGEMAGYIPDGGDPIVKLQLARAAARPGLRRIIWAPKVLPATEAGGVNLLDRKPFDVLQKFGQKLPADRVDGSEFMAFVTKFVVPLLDHTAPQGELDEISADGQVYVYHHAEDRSYAVTFARALKIALKQLRIQPILPTIGGDQTDIELVHRRALEECDAVVLCWANAADSWVKARTNEWKRWQDLGRKRRFAWRALVAYPPPNDPKLTQVEFVSPAEIDVVLDLTDPAKSPTEDVLAPLVQFARTDDHQPSETL